MKTAQESSKYLLVSDLDDTLLGDLKSLEQLAEYCSTIRHQLAIVYASGRFYRTIKRDIETLPLPDPVAVIGGVGSEIRNYPDGEINQKWIQRISANWSADRLREVLADEASLELQPESLQSDFKVSYFFRDATQQQLNRLHSKLFDEGINASLIYSSQRDLDFLPEGVNKGTAAAFIARQLGFDHDQTVVAGNSGNDSKLFEHDNYGIIVANAHDELKAYADDARVYLSPHERAAGVRDGIEHWLNHGLEAS